MSEIWIKFAQAYEEAGDIQNMVLTFERATKQTFKTPEELAEVWLMWAETLIKNKWFRDASAIIKKAIFRRPGTGSDFLVFNTRLWSFYIDLELNIGTLETVKMAYDRCIELKVVTPKMVLNYVDYLVHRGYYEDCFKVFEKSFRLFNWPVLYDLWVNYLYRFVERFEDTKVERTRDLFEKVLSEVPIEHSYIFYLMYANFEERFGLLNHAIEIYDRLVDRCEEASKEKFYNLYMSKVASFLGVTKTRPIFEKAINELTRGSKITMGLRYFILERKLGEIDRARQILLHLGQYVNPSNDQWEFWKAFSDFEINHGNEDTYREMMRTKRTVESKFNILPPDIQMLKEQILGHQKA